MSKTVKFTVSMTAAAFREIEAARRKTGKTRSQVVREAFQALKAESGRTAGVKEDMKTYGEPGSTGMIDREERRRRAIAAAGRFRSSVGDLAAEHDRYLDDAFKEVSAGEVADKGD